MSTSLVVVVCPSPSRQCSTQDHRCRSREGDHFAVKGRGKSLIDGRFYELAARGFSLLRRVGVPETLIPHEFDALEKILKDKFHRSGPERQINIVPRRDPLPALYGLP
jgi:hypothetical protein